MRHAARQPPDRFHLARLLQLVLEHLAVGDIDDYPFHYRMTVTSAHHDRGVAYPDGFPVLMHEAVFGLEWFSTRAAFFGGNNDRMILGGNVTQPIT